MTFPRKWNRRIVVGDETYLWHFIGNDPWDRSSWQDRHLVIRHLSAPRGQLLLLDVYSHDFKFRPRSVREAITFALANGWIPKVKQYTRVYRHPPSVT